MSEGLIVAGTGLLFSIIEYRTRPDRVGTLFNSAEIRFAYVAKTLLMIGVGLAVYYGAIGLGALVSWVPTGEETRVGSALIAEALLLASNLKRRGRRAPSKRRGG